MKVKLRHQFVVIWKSWVDNRCETRQFPTQPIYPDNGSVGVLPVEPETDKENVTVYEEPPVQEEEIPEVDEEFNVEEEPTMEDDSSEDVEEVEESSE